VTPVGSEGVEFIRMMPPTSGLILFPHRPGPEPFLLTATIARLKSTAVWLIGCAVPEPTERLAAQTLALVVVHERCPLLLPTLNPRIEREPLLFITPRGFSDLHTVFPKEMTAEIDRVASLLLDHHSQYVEATAAALRGTRPQAFAPLPLELELRDQLDEASWAPKPPEVGVDLSRLAPYNHSDVLFRFVQLEYRKARYLEHATDEEVMQRGEDALVNLHQFEGSNKLVVDFQRPAVVRAMARLYEAGEELILRGQGQWPDVAAKFASGWDLPTAGSALIDSVMQFIRTSGLSPETAGFFRYSSRARLESLLDTGELWLSPASGMDDPSLNRAQRDKELEFDIEEDPTGVVIQILSDDRSTVLGSDPPLRLTRTKRSVTDFYALCSSRTLTSRLFFDFSADSCLICNDGVEFVRRVEAAVRSQLPGWKVFDGSVRYFDPYSRVARRATIPFFKTVRFEYQQEFRIAIAPPEPIPRLEPRSINIGPIDDIASIFTPSNG